MCENEKHVCASCLKTVGVDCGRKRKQSEGFCRDWKPSSKSKEITGVKQ